MTFISTYTGRRFYPLDPNPSDVCIEDIAHALAMICRFNGHVKNFYCPTPDQRVLTEDLRWVPVDDLKVGDGLLAFDEHPHVKGQAGKNRRRLQHSYVTHRQNVRRRLIRLEMSDGSTVTTSAEHPWLIANKVSGNQKWESAEQIAEAIAAGRRRTMHKFLDVWDEGTSRDAGWLSGIYDGEGHLSFTGRTGTQMGVAQRPGLVLDKMISVHESLGFADDSYLTSIGDRDVVSLQLRGGYPKMFELLGKLQPVRLMHKFTSGLRSGAFDKQLRSNGNSLEIVKAWDEGEGWVSGMETSTHTYFCEGYGAHNCVAEHSVHVSRIVPPEYALAGLLHDASEAYIADVSRPVKHTDMMAGYRMNETRLMLKIFEALGIDGNWTNVFVASADCQMLALEARSLLPYDPWMDDLPEPADVELGLWGPEVAEWVFLERYRELVA